MDEVRLDKKTVSVRRLPEKLATFIELLLANAIMLC